MAPMNERLADSLSLDEKPEEAEDQSIWSAILSQVQASSINKLPSSKSLFVLGDDESGKTTLIAKLQGNEDPKKGSGLEYHSIAVKDDYREDMTRLGVWVLDGDPWHRNLLKFVLSEETFPNVTVLLTASMSQPWDILESLQNWANILEEHINRLKIPHDQMETFTEKCLRRYQEYIEPGDELEAVARKTSSPLCEEAAMLPLGENTLVSNLGLDIVVAITKTDHMNVLEKELDYKDEHFDFIQQAIRKFCLRFGASLFYTSVKEDKNIDLLYKYLVHRIYNFSFKTPALVVEKDAVFIPSGWDNDKKIAILYENLTTVSPDEDYSLVITKPMIRKMLQREVEVSAEADQSFLLKQQAIISQQQITPTRQDMQRNPAGVVKTGERKPSGSPGVMSTPKKMDGAKVGSNSNEGVLQNFFNSLLNRKTGSPGSFPNTPLRGDKPVVRTDVAAELDRMMKGKKPGSSLDGASSSASNDDLSSPGNEL